MKNMRMKKRALSLLTVLVMIMSMTMTAFAAQDAEAATEKTATLTIKGTQEGKSYDLYRVFDLTQAGANYSYTVNADFVEYFTENEITDPVDYVSKLTNTAESVGGFAKSILSWAITNDKAPIQTVEGAEGTTTVAGLPYGYYLMNPLGAGSAGTGYPSVFALGTLSGAEGDMEITVKTEYPKLDKTVEEDKLNEASIGDTVPFKLATKVPDMTGYTKYFLVVKDRMSNGLKFDPATVAIKVGGSTLTEDDFTVYTNGDDKTGTDIQIVFKNAINYAEAAGSDITIEYNATLTEYAAIGTGNENSANLIYSNDPKAEGVGGGQPIDPNEPEDPDLPKPNDPDDPDDKYDPTGETPTSTTDTYTTELTISKIDGSTNEALTGAGFTLTGEGVNVVVVTKDAFTVDKENGDYYKLADGTYSLEEPADYKGDKYTKSTTIDVKGAGKTETDVTGMVGDDGKLIFAGLGVGTYTLSETTVPAGYNKIDDIVFEVAFDKTSNPDAPAFTIKTENSGVIASDNLLTITVENMSGSLLPETGGMGTTIFTVVGLILMLGAVIVLITKRRMSSKNI